MNKTRHPVTTPADQRDRGREERRQGGASAAKRSLHPEPVDRTCFPGVDDPRETPEAWTRGERSGRYPNQSASVTESPRKRHTDVVVRHRSFIDGSRSRRSWEDARHERRGRPAAHRRAGARASRTSGPRRLVRARGRVRNARVRRGAGADHRRAGAASGVARRRRVGGAGRRRRPPRRAPGAVRAPGGARFVRQARPDRAGDGVHRHRRRTSASIRRWRTAPATCWSQCSESGKHARAAIGMASLPLGGCIEVAVTAEVAPG